ncbi:hypothetical protein [Streptomyces sp. NPDC002159]
MKLSERLELLGVVMVNAPSPKVNSPCNSAEVLVPSVHIQAQLFFPLPGQLSICTCTPDAKFQVLAHPAGACGAATADGVVAKALPQITPRATRVEVTARFMSPLFRFADNEIPNVRK